MKEQLLLFALTVGNDVNSTTTVKVPTTDVDTLFTNGLNLAYFAGGLIAVIVIIIAGFMYTMSGGDTARVTKGRNLLIYSVTGLLVVLSAFILTNFVIGRFN